MKIAGIETYFGGKGSDGVYQTIINCIRPHDTFMAPFLVHCAVMRFKKPAGRNLGLDRDPDVIHLWHQAKLANLELYCTDGIEYLENFQPRANQRTVIYCDPPYPKSSRKSNHRYNYELTDEEHLRLLQALKRLDCDILISTYKNGLYQQELNAWRLKSFTGQTRGGPATEYLYMNFENPEGQLHDYRFLGQNFSDRQRIKRKIQRWSNRLQRLPNEETNAILTALSDNDNFHDRQHSQK